MKGNRVYKYYIHNQQFFMELSELTYRQKMNIVEYYINTYLRPLGIENVDYNGYMVSTLDFTNSPYSARIAIVPSVGNLLSILTTLSKNDNSPLIDGIYTKVELPLGSISYIYDVTFDTHGNITNVVIKRNR